MKTHVSNGSRGWAAETCVDFDVNGKPFTFSVMTFRNPSHGSGIITTADVGENFVSGTTKFKRHRMFQDFNVRLDASTARVTEKNVRVQHTRALERFHEILDKAKEHTEKLEASLAAQAAS